MRELFITLLWVVFVIDAILLVLIVLLQSGRGGGLSGMLGGGGGVESALGPKSGLNKITGWMAGIFFGAAILIGIMSRETPAMDPEDAGQPATSRPAEEKGAPSEAPEGNVGATQGDEGAGRAKDAPSEDAPGKATRGAAGPSGPPSEESP